MIGETTVGMRLCPNCANSIPEDATNCRYCKSDLDSQFPPKWLNRGERSEERPMSLDKHKRFSVPTNVIWIVAMVVVALIAFFAGRSLQGDQQSQASQASVKELQAKEQMIQSQEAQLAQVRQQLNDNSKQLADMKAKLDASQKELSVAQQRLSVAARQADRQNARRSPAAASVTSRAPDTGAPLPQSAAATRTSAPGAYETTRATSVYEGPSSNSRVIAQIGRGTRINVASATGGWLEVRSKHGNPPGYVRADDARVIGARN